MAADRVTFFPRKALINGAEIDYALLARKAFPLDGPAFAAGSRLGGDCAVVCGLSDRLDGGRHSATEAKRLTDLMPRASSLAGDDYQLSFQCACGPLEGIRGFQTSDGFLLADVRAEGIGCPRCQGCDGASGRLRHHNLHCPSRLATREGGKARAQDVGAITRVITHRTPLEQLPQANARPSPRVAPADGRLRDRHSSI
jgi:hypothetical protein